MAEAEYYKTLSYSPLTLGVCNIIYPYVDDSKDSWYKKIGGYHTGIDVGCNNVYNILSYAHIIYVCYGDRNSDDEGVVIAQYNYKTCIRYAHLKQIDVKLNDELYAYAPIGIADRFCHMEYLYYRQLQSQWEVRVANKSYYKQDPEDYMNLSRVYSY